MSQNLLTICINNESKTLLIEDLELFNKLISDKTFAATYFSSPEVLSQMIDSPHVPQTTEIHAESTPSSSPSCSSAFFWHDSSTRLLLHLYGERKEKFASPYFTKKQVRQEIAGELSKEGYEVSYIQCDNKMKSLVANYKKVKDNNNRSGAGRKSCAYFEELERLFEKDPDIRPISTASSISGFRLLAEGGSSEEPQQQAAAQPEAAAEQQCPTQDQSQTPKSRGQKRKASGTTHWVKKFNEDCERRHQEKMELLKQIISMQKNM